MIVQAMTGTLFIFVEEVQALIYYEWIYLTPPLRKRTIGKSGSSRQCGEANAVAARGPPFGVSPGSPTKRVFTREGFPSPDEGTLFDNSLPRRTHSLS